MHEMISTFPQTLALGRLTLVLLVLVGLAAVILFWLVGSYNGLVKLRNRYKNAFAQIEVQLKRRHDLIPNLIEVAKKYMNHERETLEAVIAARNEASAIRKQVKRDGESNMLALAEVEGRLTESLGKLFALSEAYPELRSNENMLQLSEELTSTENKVGFARQAYNDSVTQYNTKREQFPAVIVANSFGFRDAILFEVADASEREAVKVKF